MVLSDHGTKSDLKASFELCLTKNIFSIETLGIYFYLDQI